MYKRQDTSVGQNYLRRVKQGQGDGEPQRSLHFVQFSREHENLVATRDQLFNCLSYPDVERHALPTDHYLDSLQINAMVLLQRSSPKLVSDLLGKVEISGDSEDPAIDVALDER